jgi:hypothetical protein
MSTLIYVFINNNFKATSESFKSSYSYSEIPDYYLDTLKFNSKKFTNTYLLTQKEEIERLRTIVPSNVELIDVEEVVCTTPEFIEAQKIIDTKWARYKNDTFWYTTFIRVILLSLFVKVKGCTNNIHVEADNIIYENDFTQINNLFGSGEFGFTSEAPNSSAPSLIYLKDEKSGENLFNLHLKLLKKGDDVLAPYVGHFGTWITDMAFLDLIRIKGDNFKMLPCLPSGPFSENFDKLHAVFDPTSYGQYISGTNNGHDEGYHEARHYVGNEIVKGTLTINSSPIPSIRFNDIPYPIFNLHVHNKKKIKELIRNAGQ